MSPGKIYELGTISLET